MASKPKAFPLKSNFEKGIEPLTDNQSRAQEHFENGKFLVMSGYPGTGKTFWAMYLALCALYAKGAKQNHLLLIRSGKATEDHGFLPGTYEEKIAPFEETFKGILNNMFKTGGNYDKLKELNHLEFMSAAFLRGQTWDDCIIIVDEFQNFTFHQLDTIFTRIGTNSKIIFCGDYDQTDLTKQKELEGVKDFMTILDNLDIVQKIEFLEDDIVRSDVVKKYILAKKDLGLLYKR